MGGGVVTTVTLEHRWLCVCHREESYVNHGEDCVRLFRTPILVPVEKSWLSRLVDRFWPVTA